MYEITLLIDGLKIGLSNLKITPITEDFTVKAAKNTIPSIIDYKPLKSKYPMLKMLETSQQILFFKDGRLVRLFDKTTIRNEV